MLCLVRGADGSWLAGRRAPWLATWAGLRLGADDVINLRLALMALLPNVAGLLLAFAAGLAGEQSFDSERHLGTSLGH